MAPICITGVQDAGVHPRREIHELVADTRQFSLFVQALLHMQEMDPGDPTSYYALAGIYGYPYQPWPASHSHSHGADSDTTKNKTQWLGYCTHAHMAQTVHPRSRAQFPFPPHSLLLTNPLTASSNTFNPMQPTSPPSTQPPPPPPPNHCAYWALHPLPPPEVIEHEMMLVTTCKGKREEVRNLLLSFVFPEGVRNMEGFPKKFGGWGRTVRWPVQCDEDAKSDVEALKRALSERNAQQTQAAVYRLLVNVHT